LVSPYDFAFPGGVTSHISSLERHLTRMGNAVKVIAPASQPVSIFGDRFIPIGKPRPIPSSGSIIRVAISLRLASTIKEVLDREKFDIVHLHEPFMPMLCSAILRFSNTTNIGTFHAWDGRPGYNFGRPITSWMIRRRLHKLTGRIAVSEMAKTYVSRFIPGKYDIIPNGIDVERFSPDVAPFEEFCDGKQNILFLGRLERRKGAIYLIKAFQQVKREIPNSRLIIAGPGTRLRKPYEKWIRNHGLENDIIFTGYVPEDEKARYYKTADIYCSPATSRESFGIVLLEAMAVGTPVIVSDIDGYNSVVTQGEEGLLVPPKKTNELAQALLKLLKDESLRKKMGEKGITSARKYSWEHIAKRVYDYYTDVVGN